MPFGLGLAIAKKICRKSGWKIGVTSTLGVGSAFTKRKGSKTEYKKIPIIGKLKPYLEGKDELKFYGVNRIRERFHKIFPQKRLYDLRTTFYTRCQECGVSDVARDTFVGHSLGKLGNTYTDLSDEFLLKEGAKLNW